MHLFIALVLFGLYAIDKNDAEIPYEFPGGAAPLTEKSFNLTTTPLQLSDNVEATFPREFDAAKHWPQCADVISAIADQSNAAVCWAFAAASTFSDRVCIATNGKIKQQMSAYHLISCCPECSAGTSYSEGDVVVALDFIRKKGITTGAGNGPNATGCKPYPIKPCKVFTCPIVPAGEAECEMTCTNNQRRLLYYGRSGIYSFRGLGEQAIMRELMTNGPLVATFEVFPDFPLYNFNYKKVYVPRSKTLNDHYYHAVRVVGWGETEGVKYWKAANSWGPEWGNNGHFLIRRGSNDCGFEDGMIAPPQFLRNAPF